MRVREKEIYLDCYVCGIWANVKLLGFILNSNVYFFRGNIRCLY